MSNHNEHQPAHPLVVENYPVVLHELGLSKLEYAAIHIAAAMVVDPNLTDEVIAKYAVETAKAVLRLTGRRAMDDLKTLLCRAFTDGYGQGHHDTVEGGYTHIYPEDRDTYFADQIDEWVENEVVTDPTAEIERLREKVARELRELEQKILYYTVEGGLGGGEQGRMNSKMVGELRKRLTGEKEND